jgi:hypothetical protein
MARKSKSSSGEGLNLDSLMDALTNVVAVLILVLLLAQADVTQKVIKFIEELEPATPEEVEQNKIILQQIVDKKQAVEEKLKEDAPTVAQIEEEKRSISLLEKSIETDNKLLADVGALKNLETKVRQEREAENQASIRIQEEIAQLEAQLDQTPVYTAPPPAEVTIPNSRPIPSKAVVYPALAIKNRIHVVDPHIALETFLAEFNKHKREWLIERIKQQGSDRMIYDQKKIAQHFKTFDFKNSQGQKVEVITNPIGTTVQILIKPDIEKGGTSPEELDTPGSGFSKAVASIVKNKDAVILFHVHQDSFSTYLKARSLLDKTKIPAGWEIWGGDAWLFNIPDLEVKRLQDPPPKPPTPPKPPGPRPPPPIGPKLD